MESSSQPDSVCSEDSSPSRSGRGLRDRKKVVYNEKVMSKRASTDSSDDDDDDKEKDEALDDDDDDVDEEARRKPLELWTDGETTSTQETCSSAADSKGGGVTGHELFGFKTMKRKEALAKSVTYSTNAARSESEAAAAAAAALEEKSNLTPKKGRSNDIDKVCVTWDGRVL